MTTKKTITISIVILLVSAVITYLIFISAPGAEREGASIRTAMLVDVIKTGRGNYTPTIVATGTIQAAKDISLSTQIGGEVIEISENFVPGSFVKKGAVLLQINPADYRNILQLRRSDLQTAKADLSIEMGRQDVAQKDFELIGDELSPDSKELVLRRPQLESAKANIAAAEAAVNQAELNLHRATIRAPFDAHIINRNANVGSQLAPGTELGRLVGMEEYWLIANIPVSTINWLNFSDKDPDAGSDVKIMNDNIWPSGQYREGKLFRLVGALEEQSRLARVLVSIPDPLLRISRNDTLPPLIIGSFVEAHIQGKNINNVIRLDRDYLRQGEKVWVMDQSKLSIREVDILFQDNEYAYIRKGLSENEMVITTDLATVIEGSELRLAGDEPIQDSTNRGN